MKEILHDSRIYYFKIHIYKPHQGKSSKENRLSSKYIQVDVW